MTDRDEILARLQKLMSKTTSNGATEAEAQSAMALAQRLMAQHAIDAAEVVDKSDPVHLFGEFPLADDKALSAHVVAIIPVIETAFAVRVVVRKQMDINLTTGRQYQAGVKVVVFGDVHSSVAAKWSFDYLNATFKDLWTSFRISHKAGRKDLEPFFMGLADGMLDKLKAEKRLTELDMPRARNAIVLVKSRLDQAFAAEYPAGQQIQKAVESTDAYFEGRARGRNISMSRAIGQNKAIESK